MERKYYVKKKIEIIRKKEKTLKTRRKYYSTKYNSIK